MTMRPLWTCPKCDRPFVNANMPHSCGQYSVEAFLAGKSRHAVSLFEHFSALVHQCGPVHIAPAKTRIGFQVRMIFAAVNKLTDRGLEAHVVLTRRLEDARFTRIETMTPRCYVHYFRVESADELDDQVKRWLQEAYQVGTQMHLIESLNHRIIESSREHDSES
jgi:Domain of unknown function (DUF5655)